MVLSLFFKCIPTDLHVEQAAKILGWVPANATTEETRLILEDIIPRHYWMHFNEVYGAMGQIFRISKNQPLIKEVMEKVKDNITISKELFNWMEIVGPTRSKKQPPKQNHNSNRKPAGRR